MIWPIMLAVVVNGAVILWLAWPYLRRWWRRRHQAAVTANLTCDADPALRSLEKIERVMQQQWGTDGH